MSEKPLLETRHLKKYFRTPAGELHAVDDVNIAISRGSTLGVVGESGCGKSTLGRTILRLIEPTSGEIYYQGEDIRAVKGRKMAEMRRNMQIIFQDPYSSINSRMTVLDIIAEHMIVNKTYATKQAIYDRAAELMDIVGLAPRLANTYPHELDGGRRQRIGIARALCLNPQFIVCDEPVSALDVSIQAQILNLLMDLQDEMGITYMFITHNLSVVKHISSEIAVMYLGVIVEKAETEELFLHPKHPYTKALLAAIPYPDFSHRDDEIQIIRGEVSSPINPKPGCRFAARCDYATAVCRGTTPELKEVEKGHYCACHLTE